MPDTVDMIAVVFDARCDADPLDLSPTQRAAMFRIWATDRLITASHVERDPDDGGEAMGTQAVVDALATTLNDAAVTHRTEDHHAFIIVEADVAGVDVPVRTVVTIDFGAGAASWAIDDDGTRERCTIVLGAAHIANRVKATLR